MSAGPVNQTLYVNNLNDKINPETVKKSLREVFAAFGGIMDIIAMKSLRRRGQAWIVFKDHASATNALKSLQGFPFYNKPMRIAYARTKSDAVARADGTYAPRVRKTIKKDPTKKAAEKAKATVSLSSEGAGGGYTPSQPVELPPQAAAQTPQTSIQERISWNPNQMAQARAADAPKPALQTAPQPSAAPPPPQMMGMAGTLNQQVGPGQPNKTLFVENLPPEANETMLSMLFRQYPGFLECRLIPGRAVAFADYQTEFQSGMALQGLQGFGMSHDCKLRITYAKK